MDDERPDPRLLAGDEAAARLGISERTLRKLRQAGEIAYIAITPRTIRYTAADCDAFLASHRRIDQQPEPTRAVGRRIASYAGGASAGGFMAGRASRKPNPRSNR